MAVPNSTHCKLLLNLFISRPCSITYISNSSPSFLSNVNFHCLFKVVNALSLSPVPTSVLQRQTLVDSYMEKLYTNQVYKWFTVRELNLEERQELCFKVGTCWFYLLNISWKHLLLSIFISIVSAISFSTSLDFITSPLDYCPSLPNSSSAFTVTSL